MSTTILPQQEIRLADIPSARHRRLRLMLIAAGATLMTPVLFFGFYWIVSGTLNLSIGIFC